MSKIMRMPLIGIVILSIAIDVHAQNDVDCSNCVDTTDIRFQAVTTGKIAPEAVTTGKIENGAVTVNKVSPKLSNSIGTYCLPDETVVGMDAQGNFSCEMPQTLASDDNKSTRAGAGALSVNSGVRNTAVGYHALLSNTIGKNNTAVGHLALEQNTTGIRNTGVGKSALALNTTGSSNTATGYKALWNNSNGVQNTANGTLALSENTTGANNTAVGNNALLGNTAGRSNTAIGSGALVNNTTGDRNTASGKLVLGMNTTGAKNTAAGEMALFLNTTGESSTAIGHSALLSNTTGSRNIAIGQNSGLNHTTGDDNIAIGNEGVSDESATIRIGSNTQTRTFISGIRGVLTGIDDAAAIVIDSNGQLGTVSSSRRYKEEIHDMESASERLLDLRPVTFRYKEPFANGEKPVQFGLIAEEVAEIFPELVAYDEDGSPEAVKYRLLSALLLNEYQKQHSEIQTLLARLEQLEKTRSVGVAHTD